MTSNYPRWVWKVADEWRAYRGAVLHPLFTIPGLSILNVQADVMHIVCLGVAHHMLGNVLYELCFETRYFPLGRSPEDRCDRVWSKVARRDNNN